MTILRCVCAIPITASLLLAVGCATKAGNPEQVGASTPYGGTAHAIPGLIEAEHFDEGGPGVAYYDVDEVNHGARYRGVTHVDIEERSDASNGHGIGWTRAGEWLVYTINVRQTGTYQIEIPVASQGQGGVFHLEIAGKDVSGPIRVPDTGAWTKLEMLRMPNVRLTSGNHAMRMVMDSEGASGSIGDIDYLKFELQH